LYEQKERIRSIDFPHLWVGIAQSIGKDRLLPQNQHNFIWFWP